MYNDKRRISSNKYRRNKLKQFVIAFNKETEADIIEALEQKESKQAFIKEIIKKEIRGS